MVPIGGRRPLACRDVVELVSDYLDEALTPAVRTRLEEHLRSCRNCAAYLQQMRTTVRALARLAAPALGRGERDALVARYRTWTAA